MESSPQVLIVSAADWIAPPQLAGLLGQAGAIVATLASPQSKLGAAKAPGGRFRGSEDPAQTLELLRLHLAADRRYDWIVFGDDLLLAAAVARAHEPWLAAILPCAPTRGAAAALVSKTAFSRTMHVAGVAMPAGCGAANPAEIATAAATVGFPVLVKPDCGYAGLGMFAADNAAELAAHSAKAKGACLVERRITGRLGGTAVLFDHGRAAWWSSFFKTGVMPTPFGPICRRQVCDPPGIEQLLGQIGAVLGLHGLCGVDWLLAADGRLTVIELNGRPIPLDEGNPQTRPVLLSALRDFLASCFAVRPPLPVGTPAKTWHMLPKSFSLAFVERDYLLAARLACGLGGRTDRSWAEPQIISAHFNLLFKVVCRKLTRR